MNGLQACVCMWLLADAGAALADRAVEPALYLGYFVEDAMADPVDPLAGILYLRLSADRFDGSLLYAVHGCRDGIDQARVSGRRVAGGLGGAWSGDFDGKSAAGSFEGLATGSHLAGSYTGAAGTHSLDCDADGRTDYTIAALGQWRLWPLGEGSLRIDADPVGALRWRPPQPTAHHWLRVLDAACLRLGGELGRCLRVDDDLTAAVVDPRIWAASLAPGREHVLVILSIGHEGEILAFGSRAFTSMGRH